MKETKKILSLTRNHLFVKAYKKGTCYASKTLVLYVMKNYDRNTTLLGITTGKVVGNAVKRNKTKRKVRESFRLIYPFVKKGYILVFVSRACCREARFEIVKDDMYMLLKKARLLQEE